MGSRCQFGAHADFYGDMEKSAVDDLIHVHRTGGAIVVAGVSVDWTTGDIRASDSSDGNCRLRGVCDALCRNRWLARGFDLCSCGVGGSRRELAGVSESCVR